MAGSSKILEWLLDLRDIRLATDAPLSLEWLLPYPPWMLFGFGLLLLACVAMTYRREEGPMARRSILASLRGALVGLAGVVICQPVLILQRSRVERASVLVMVDVSSSMNRKDALSATASTTENSTASRLDQVRGTLLIDAAAALRTVLDKNELKLLTFAGEVELRSTAENVESLPGLVEVVNGLESGGHQTDLFHALAKVLQRRDWGPIAAVVLASDGQSTESSGQSEALELAQSHKIPIYSLLIGSPMPPRDVGVGPVSADRNVFARDIVSILARVSATGFQEETECPVELTEEDGGTVLATRTVSIGGESTARDVEFLVRPSRTGRVRYRISVPPREGEVDTGNNVDRVEINVVKDPLHVLYVEGYPRYEYRYLKNGLLREETVKLGCLLLSADRNFAQEGTEPVRRFPETVEELHQYDVVLFGDVDPQGDWWNPQQAEMLVNFVGEHGGGFGLIAGERHAPHRYAGTPLQKLIPVRIDPAFQGRYTTTMTQAYGLHWTAEGRHSRIFRFYDDAQVNDQVLDSLPGLYWIAQTLGPRPGAEVLVEHESLENVSGRMPVCVLGRYGAGVTYFQATDDTWLWRRHTGEALYDAYVVQVVRALAPSRQPGHDPRMTLRTLGSEYSLGRPVQVILEVHDPELLVSLSDKVRLAVVDAQSRPVMNTTLQALGNASNEFEAVFVPPHAGSFTLLLPDVPPPPGEQPTESFIRVTADDLESLHPEANHDLLRKLAAETDGQVADPENLNTILAQIPDRGVRTPDDVTEPLWDSKLVLILFVSIITMEWMVRKAYGMI